jgi:prevent-host-death family protein
MKVGVYEAKSKLSQMIDRALAGEEVVITRNGEEVIELRPVKKKRKTDWIGMWKGQVIVHDDFDDPLDDDETVKYLTGEIETDLFPVDNEDTD